MDERSLSSAGSCCFCFVSKRKKRKSTTDGGYAVELEEDMEIEMKKERGGDEWGKKDEMLSDLSTFSVKEQERRLKKAMEEEEKVIKEAERVVKWVKQESSRIDVSTIDRVLKEDGDDQLVK